ncbi:MAG: caspase family protein [Hyphomonadaceae bacterium JAD_PAG50586_4]|nr:MAG: caspase family protein [Hyphomonadaceae bacterium JAD_PAG50586_4]
MFRAVFIALVALMVFAPQSSAQERLALIIANADYNGDNEILPAATQLPPSVQTDLVNPTNDARGLAALLGSDYGSPTPLEDQDFAQMSEAIANFAMRVAQADEAAIAASRPRPLVVVYFAGHGFEFGGQNYIVPVRTALPPPSQMQGAASAAQLRLVGRAIPVNDIVAVFADRGEGTTLVIIDACRNNPWARAARGARSGSDGLAPMAQVGSIVIALSAEPGRTASDGPPDGMSPFAAALIAQGARREMSFWDAYSLVVTDVMSATGNGQRPWIVGSPAGRFCLLPCMEPRSIDTERRAFLAASADGNIAAYDGFIAQFPNSEYAYAASVAQGMLSLPAQRPPSQDNAPPPVLQEPAATSPPPQPPPPREVCPTASFVLYFEFERATLLEAARETLAAALGRARRCTIAGVTIETFVDASETGGAAGGSFRGLERARTVHLELERMGLINAVRSLRVLEDRRLTGLREPTNRRVGVTIQFS